MKCIFYGKGVMSSGVITVVDLESSGSLENEVDKHIQVASMKYGKDGDNT